MNGPTVRITVHGDETIIETPYHREFVAELKAKIPAYARRWDNDNKAWIVAGLTAREAAIRLCRCYFSDLTFSGNGYTPAATAMAAAPNWAVSLFLATPERLHEPLYRALAKVLHPDIGGDTEATKTLTAAYAERAAA